MAKHVSGISSEKLVSLAGPDWENFTFGRDGLFYIDGWRRGFSPAEIRSYFFSAQQIGHLRNKDAELRRELEAAIQDAQEAERLAGWYRQQLVLESRMGLALSRIAG